MGVGKQEAREYGPWSQGFPIVVTSPSLPPGVLNGNDRAWSPRRRSAVVGRSPRPTTPPAQPAVNRMPSTVGLLVVLALVASACAGSAGDEQVVPSTTGATPTSTSRSVGSDPSTADPPLPGPSALRDRFDPALPTPLVDPGLLRSGGPPPDGIPPIDSPLFIATSEATDLEAVEPVLAFSVGDDHRAYPIRIMIWHEIVNDTVGGVPVAVTYCPLCNSAVAYDRRLDGRTLTFGTSGMLYNSALVMYDRQTESLWSHFTGEAIIGRLVGHSLDVLPVSTVSWGQWSAAHPDGLVLSADTGFRRDYGRNPYPGYDDVGTPPFLFQGETDDRLLAKRRVIGILGDGGAVAVRRDLLAEAGVVEFQIDGAPMVALHDTGMASALDDGSIAEGRDIGTAGVFSSVLDGRRLHLRSGPDGFVDDETSSGWNVLGEAVSGPLAGQVLDPVVHVDTFWFAWAAFRPGSSIVPVP
jgi:hypothetical protein